MNNESTYLEKNTQHWAEALADANALVRRLAAYALGEIGPPAKTAIPALSAALQDETSFVRTWAAAALARIDPDNTTAITTLAASMSDERPFVRSLAVWHLGRLGPEAPGLTDVLPTVHTLLDDSDRSVRVEAELALHRLHHERSFQAHKEAVAQGASAGSQAPCE